MAENLTNKMETNNNFTGAGPSNIVQQVHGDLINHTIVQRYSPPRSESRERKAIRHNIKPPVPSFTGRKDEQKELQGYLQHQNEESSTSTAAVIIGLGGTGKTELARAYAHENSGYYENIVWIDSETSGTMRYTFETLAKEMGIIKDEANTSINKTTENNEREEKRRLEVILPKVYEFLSESKTLLIFDNAEGFPTIKPFLPPLSKENIKKIHILLTYQVKEWKVMDEYITFNECHLEDLLPEHAKQFVKLQLNDICDDDIDKLIEAVGCFPLALTQAVAFIKQQREMTHKLSEKTYNIADYLKVFRDETRKVLDNVNTIIHHPYARTVYKTLGLTIDKLSKEKNGQEAVNVLTIVAYLAPDDIHVKKMFKGDENAFLLLDKYSMMKIVAGVASIHRLLQQVIRLRNQDEEIVNLKKALSVVRDDKELDEGIYYNHVMFVWTYAMKHKVFLQKVTSYKYTCFNGHYYPLQIFVFNNNYEGAQDLLANIPVGKRKKVCNFKSNWGPDGTSLKLAIEYKASLNLVKLLLENGANVPSDELHRAVINNAHLDVVKYLIKNGAKVNAKNSNGGTPLHVAVSWNSNFELVQCLIENGADINSRNKVGETPLHKVNGYVKRDSDSTPANKAEIVKILLENGADINVKDKNEQTPLHAAVSYSINLKFVKCLVENGADINTRNKDGDSPLLTAIWTDDLKFAKCLIENFAEINVKDKLGRTPLHKAVERAVHDKNHLELVKCLIKNGAEVNVKNIKGETPLHVANLSYECNIELMKFLVENGADDINVTDNKWRSPLHSAIANGHDVELVKYLIENGAAINVKDKLGVTALHEAVSRFRPYLNVVKLLIAYGADVNAKDEDGKTPLHVASDAGVMEFLLQNGADVNATDKDGRTPLHTKAGSYDGDLDRVKLLIGYGAEVNAKDKKGGTPLHEAAYEDKRDIVDFLIKNGADIKAKDEYLAVYNSFMNKCRIS